MSTTNNKGSTFRPLFFQIGFNKTATTALYKLFLRGPKIKPIHSAGRKWRRKGHPAIVKAHPQRTIHQNIQEGRDPLESLEDFNAFFDMEFITHEIYIENYKAFALLEQTYQNAKFLLNIRPRDEWIRSRSRHSDGKYLEAFKTRLQLDEAGVIRHWENEYDSHISNVRAYFADKPEKFMEFDVGVTSIDTLIDFCAPEFQLSPQAWQMVRVTDRKAKAKGWGENAPNS